MYRIRFMKTIEVSARSGLQIGYFGPRPRKGEGRWGEGEKEITDSNRRAGVGEASSTARVEMVFFLRKGDFSSSPP